MEKPIIVSGVVRSGSTWTGKMIGFAKEVQYIHEPFAPHRNIPGTPVKGFFDYLREDQSDHISKKYREYYMDVLNFKVPGLYDIGNIRNGKKIRWLYQPLLSVFRSVIKKRPLIKDPLALLMVPWMVKQVPSHVIIVVRHPAAFVNSCKKAGWGFDMRRFLEQEYLMSDYLEDFRDEMEYQVNNECLIVDQAILFWKIMHAIIFRYKQEHLDWCFVSHEQLSTNPIQEFKRLYGRLSLTFDNKVMTHIKSFTTSSKEDRLIRDSKRNVTAWKNGLTNKEIALVKDRTSGVWEYFYTENDW